MRVRVPAATAAPSATMRSPTTPNSPSPFTPSSSSAPPAVGHGTRDAESLFRTKPITEIRSVEASTRREIEAKKEELRQLVGKSYRDLIDSADSILLMRSTCESIASNLDSVDAAVRSLSAAASSSDDARRPPADPARARVHGLASRVKYLVDTPENIWGCLDESMLLEAAGRYLRAKVVHRLVGNDGEVVARFPLLRHQWQIVESFKAQISQRSRERLTEQGLSVTAYADALAAVSIIDELDPKQILELFLDSRRSWVSQKLAGVMVDVETCSEVLVDVMRTIRASLGQVGELFVLALSEMPLFYKIALGSPPGSQVFGGIHNPEEEVRLWRLHIEKLESVMVLMEPEYIAQTCSSWLRFCCDEIFGELAGGKRLIDAISSGEGLGSAEKLVREALNSREDLDESLDQWLKSVFGSDLESPWNQIRRFILKDGMDIFEDQFEEALVNRMKKIVHTELENLNKDIQLRRAIEAISGEEEKFDGNQFEAYLKKPYNGGVWFSDPHQKKAGLLHAFKTTVEETDFRSCLNAYFGPEVSRIRDTVDNKCHGILEDLLCFVECHNSSLRLKELAPYLQENCYSTISLLVRELEVELESLSSSLENHIMDGNSLPPAAIVERSLFIGRLLYALRSHSNYIPLILGSPRQWVKDTNNVSMGNLLSAPSPRQPKMSLESPVSFSPRRHTFDSPRSPKGQLSFDNRRQAISVAAALFSPDDSISRKLDELNKNLLDLSIKAHNVWATWVANELSAILLAKLSRDETLSLTSALQGWEVTVIKQEEFKEGPPEVTIALPSMPSLYISSFLFQACLEIHKVGGHILDKLIVHKFSWRLLQKVLSIYEKFLANLEGGESHVSEKGILQILFDLRFITDILSGGKDSATSSFEISAKTKEDSSRISTLKSSFRRTVSHIQSDSAHSEFVTTLINRLSQRLDPIDWAMYEPYLWENEKQSYKRYAVLFGFLVQLNRLYTDTAQKLPTKSNTGSNIMRCSTVPRFKYLPISAPVLSSRGAQKSALHNLSDDASVRSPWKHSNGDQSPKTELDGSQNFGVAAPLLKSIMTVGSKFGESTSSWGSMLSDGQVGRLKDRSAAAMSTFGDILPGPAAGLFSSLTSGASRFNS